MKLWKAVTKRDVNRNAEEEHPFFIPFAPSLVGWRYGRTWQVLKCEVFSIHKENLSTQKNIGHRQLKIYPNTINLNFSVIDNRVHITSKLMNHFQLKTIITTIPFTNAQRDDWDMCAWEKAKMRGINKKRGREMMRIATTLLESIYICLFE